MTLGWILSLNISNRRQNNNINNTVYEKNIKIAKLNPHQDRFFLGSAIDGVNCVINCVSCCDVAASDIDC